MAIAQEQIQRIADGKANDLIKREHEERERIGRLVENAYTSAEVQEAIAALRGWASANPAEPNQFVCIFEQLAMAEESAREAQAEARAMGLTEQEVCRREQVFALRRRVRAEDPPDVFASALRDARQFLTAWQAIHPEDPQISCLRDALHAEESAAITLHEVDAP